MTDTDDNYVSVPYWYTLGDEEKSGELTISKPESGNASSVHLLVAEETLPERCVDHSLSGNWPGWRDCHIEPDWILVYKMTADTLTLGRTGSHSDLF